jgi:hypothetical protein
VLRWSSSSLEARSATSDCLAVFGGVDHKRLAKVEEVGMVLGIFGIELICMETDRCPFFIWMRADFWNQYDLLPDFSGHFAS